MRILSARTRPVGIIAIIGIIGIIGVIAVLVASALLGLVVILHRSDPPEGLTATFFADTDWGGPPVTTFLDPLPSSESFTRAFGRNAPEMFSATWTGTLAVLQGGTHTFAVESDDAAWLYVDDVLVVDNSGRHSRLRSSGKFGLSRGPHQVLVKYVQYGGDANLSLFWTRGEGTPKPLTSAFLFPQRLESSPMRASVILRQLIPVVAWIWIGVVSLVIVATAWPRAAAAVSAVCSDAIGQLLVAVVCVSIVLNVVGVWWGVPSGWAGDEISPMTVRKALDHRFSGGWFDRYPPFHMQVLGMAFTPWLVAEATGLVQPSDVADYGTLLVISRLVSVLAGAATVFVLFRIGRESFGARAGLLAAAAFALLAPFLYYAKTANPEVPYVFWFVVSLLFYLRALRTALLRDCVLFALASVLSICTKDQAYGLYLLSPFPLVYRLWEIHRDAGEPKPLLRAVADRRIWVALAAAVALFGVVHNIPFNAAGFMKHVRDIVGPGQEGYQMVDATIGGRLRLLQIAADLNQRSWGWPLWLAAVAGVVMALGRPSSRRTAIVLLSFAVSYHFGFMNVVRYAFDRYLLPICAIEALFVGDALDRLLTAARGQSLVAARAVIAIGFLYSALYAGTVDVLMVRDARYAAEQWLRAHAGRQSLVGIMFPETVLPRLRDFQVAEIDTIRDLHDAQPAFFLLNADYARAVPSGRPEGQLAAGLQRETIGYRLAFRSSRFVPWPWLPWGHPNLVGRRDEVPVRSVLTQLSPTIEIYARDGDDAR